MLASPELAKFAKMPGAMEMLASPTLARIC